MADVIMQLTQFQTPRKNFSIFNFTTVRLREHERDSLEIQSAVVFPKVSTDISDEAMSIEDLSPPTGKFNRSQTSRSRKFSDAPESMRTCTGESFNVPSTTADPKLAGAEARKGRCTDGIGAVIAAEATSFDETSDRQTRAK